MDAQLPELQQAHTRRETARLWQASTLESTRVRTEVAQQLGYYRQEIRKELAREEALRRDPPAGNRKYSAGRRRELEEEESVLNLAEQKLGLVTKLEPLPPADAQQALERLRQAQEKCEKLYELLPERVASEVVAPRWPPFSAFPDNLQSAFLTGLRAGHPPYFISAFLALVLDLSPLLALFGLARDGADRGDNERRRQPLRFAAAQRLNRTETAAASTPLETVRLRRVA